MNDKSTLNNEFVCLPLFPMEVVIVPYGKMVLEALAEPYVQLLKDCIKNKDLFLSVYCEDDKMCEIGCVCEIMEYKIEGEKVTCVIYALRRVEINSLVTFSDDMHILHKDGKKVCFELDKPVLNLPYQFANVSLYLDKNNIGREDLKEQVYTRFIEMLANHDDQLYRFFIDLSKKEELDESISFFILALLLKDDTKEGNIIKYEMLKRKSESRRLCILREILYDETEIKNFRKA